MTTLLPRTSLFLQARLRWPVLARAIDAAARATDEAQLHVTVDLEGPAHALRGRFLVEATFESSVLPSRQLLDLAVRGVLTELERWKLLSLVGDRSGLLGETLTPAGPLRCEMTLPNDHASPEGGVRGLDAGLGTGGLPSVSHITTNLLPLLSIPGGRYGPPSCDLAIATGPVPLPGASPPDCPFGTFARASR